MNRGGGKPGKEFWLGALRQEATALRAAISPDNLQAAVPACGDWTVEQLIHHVGSVYQWVRGHVVREVTSKPEPFAPASAPTGPAVLDWWDEQYEQLLATLDRLDPEQPAWNWAPQAKKAVFWHRRMAHETAVHRWDAQMATAGITEPIEPKLAADGIAEVLDTWLPAGRRHEVPERVAGLVQLLAEDVGQEWLVRLRGAGVALLDTSTVMHEHHEIDAQAVGTASDLQLALWGRVPFDVVETAGETRLFRALRTG